MSVSLEDHMTTWVLIFKFKGTSSFKFALTFNVRVSLLLLKFKVQDESCVNCRVRTQVFKITTELEKIMKFKFILKLKLEWVVTTVNSALGRSLSSDSVKRLERCISIMDGFGSRARDSCACVCHPQPV